MYKRQIGYLALGNNRSLGVVNDRYLQNLAYCRVKNITVRYTIPAVWTKKVKDVYKRQLVFRSKKRKRMTEIVMVTKTVPAVCSRKETERTANLI